MPSKPSGLACLCAGAELPMISANPHFRTCAESALPAGGHIGPGCWGEAAERLCGRQGRS